MTKRMSEYLNRVLPVVVLSKRQFISVFATVVAVLVTIEYTRDAGNHICIAFAALVAFMGIILTEMTDHFGSYKDMKNGRVTGSDKNKDKRSD